MQVRKGKKRKAGLRKRFIQQSRIFAKFSQAFQAKGDEDLAKVSTGLSQVCTMLAEQTKEESPSHPVG